MTLPPIAWIVVVGVVVFVVVAIVQEWGNRHGYRGERFDVDRGQWWRR